jgi:UDP-glucose 4-epimerase
MFRPPVMVRVAGYDPRMQFVHEEDLVEVIVACLGQGKAGVFNVAGEGELLYSEVARLAGKRMVAIPESVLRSVLGLSWFLRLQSEAPVSGLGFIKYPPVVSTEKLKKEMGFRFRYSSADAVAAFVSPAQAIVDHSAQQRKQQ